MADSIVTQVEQCLGEVRIVTGSHYRTIKYPVFQQKWKITTVIEGVPHQVKEEWRDVPQVIEGFDD